MDERTEVRDQTAKADAGKRQIHLVPPQIMYDIAQVREYGAEKYKDPENWKKVSLERYIDALGRHYLEMLKDPRGKDPESGIEHYKHVACNLAFICEFLKDTETEIPELDCEEWESVLDEADDEEKIFREAICAGCTDYIAPERISNCSRCFSPISLLSVGKKGGHCEAEYICKDCEHIEKLPFKCVKAEEFERLG